MIKPFFQGKLDTFCAIYAVLNAYRLLYGMRKLKARDILNETLIELSANRKEFERVLNQETDYIGLVDHLLNKYAKKLSYKWSKPYADKNRVSKEEMWTDFQNWLGEYPDHSKNRTLVFRFLKFLNADQAPLNRHWTTGEYVKNDYLHLFDSSHEAEAILNVHRDAFVTDAKDIDADHLIVIPPSAVRLLII